MKIFKTFNVKANDPCLICQTKEEKPVTLVGVDGTEKDKTEKAIQVHIDCIALRYSKKAALIYMTEGAMKYIRGELKKLREEKKKKEKKK